MTAQGPLTREQVEGAQALLAALTGLRTGGYATAGNAGMGAPSETPAGTPIAGGPQSMQPASPADLLGAIYGALNQQAAKVPGASTVAGLGRRGGEMLREWAAAAPEGSDMRKSREVFGRLYDFVIPQDELGAVLAVIPPAKAGRVAGAFDNITSKELAHRFLNASADDAVDILEELQRRGYDPDLARSIPLDRRTPPEPGRRRKP